MTSSGKKNPTNKKGRQVAEPHREDRCKATGIIGHVWSQQIVCSLGKKKQN